MSRFLEDVKVGDVYRSELGRTITDVDNIWFTLLTMNTNQIHFNEPYASRTQFKRMLVDSTLTLAVIVGLSVADISQNAVANLSWDDVRLPVPVYAGDTLWAETEVLSKRDSRTRPNVGIVSCRTRGLNQRGETVIEFLRTIMLFKRGAPEVGGVFPAPMSDWAVGEGARR